MRVTHNTVFLSLIIFLLAPLSAQVVQVEGVKNRVLRNGWLQSSISLATNANTDPKAVNPNFVEDITVTLYLGFKNEKVSGGIDFYTASVSILALEKGDKNTVSFYIPNKIMEMNRYSSPTYYFAEVLLGNRAQQYNQNAFSRNFNSKESLNSFKNKAKTGSLRNKGRLMPSYFAPISFQSSTEEVTPIYLRTESTDY
jgi:hypothetical protein